MNFVTIDDLCDLGLGAALLGSGGGGSPEYDILMAENHLMDYGNVRLASVDELKEDDLVLPLAFAGAPLVGIEMLPSGRECDAILQSIEAVLGRKPTHLMPAEIGGGNALCPFLFAARLNLPVLDADTLGRAFPELQMSSCNLFKVSVKPAFIADGLGNSVVINANDASMLEELTRKNVIAMGSSALVGVYLMDGLTAKKAVVKGSISQSILLGRSLRKAKALGQDPLQALQESHGAKILGSGVIDNISQSIEEGFLNGSVSIVTGDGRMNITYQNEYLKVEKQGRHLSVTPEIITILDSESFLPISSEKLLYGLRVTVVTLPAPSIWTTPEGLELVGPEYFGINVNEVAHG